MQQGKLWTRAFIVLMGINFCSALSFYLTMVKMTEFAVDTYGVAYSIAGTTITAYVISALLTRLFFGGKIDSWGVKRSLVIGTIVNAVAMALYLLELGFVPLIVVRIVHGFAFALMSGSAAAGAALVIPHDRYGEGIGYFSMMQALATGIGPFVAILITRIFGGYAPMFAVATGFAVLAVLSLLLLEIPQTSKDDTPSDALDKAAAPHMRAKRGLSSLIQVSVIPLAATLFLCYLGYSGILSFLTLYAQQRGLGDAVSLYFVVYAVVILVSRPPVGRRVDRVGENSVIYWCFLSLTFGLVLLALASNGAVLLLSAAFVGFGIGATQSIVQAVIARDTSQDELGRANSTFFMSMDLGSGIGPVVIGAVIPFIGYSVSYLALAVCAVLAGVVYHFAHGRHQ